MSYLFNGVLHDNYSHSFLSELGMSDDTIASVIAQREYEQGAGLLAMRQRAYERESDPLFLEWQYDRTPLAETAWLNKVAEIKGRYPITQ